MFAFLKRILVINAIKQLPIHNVTVVDEHGKTIKVATNVTNDIVLTIHDRRFYQIVADNGEMGFGVAYGKGYWTSNNVSKLIDELVDGLGLVNNPNVIRNMIPACKKPMPDTDCNEDIYFAFLDETFLSYSTGIYNNADDTLTQAMRNKLNLIISLLDIKVHDVVLDVGCGWGRMANYLKETSKCATLDAISKNKEQIEYGKQAPMPDLNFIQANWRSHTKYEHYDKICVIELIEYVPKNDFGNFFEAISRNLKSGGKCVIITTVSLYDKDDVTIDTFTTYPLVSTLFKAINSATLLTVQDFRILSGKDHYAKTFDAWHQNLCCAPTTRNINIDAVKTYEYYLATSAAMFRTGKLATCVCTLQKHQGIDRLVGDQENT
jgi:cyclopropane fatty-acyl-phospholipid synthase-like methyltransferase